MEIKMKLRNYIMALGLVVATAGFNSSNAMQPMPGQMGSGKGQSCKAMHPNSISNCMDCCQHRWTGRPQKLNKCVDRCQGQRR
jgi:hypothetical protein